MIFIFKELLSAVLRTDCNKSQGSLNVFQRLAVVNPCDYFK